MNWTTRKTADSSILEFGDKNNTLELQPNWIGALQEIASEHNCQSKAVRLLIQDRYNHASLNDKPEVAAAMKELLERMERV